MAGQFPKLADQAAENGGEKVELVNVMKANEIHSAVVASDEQRLRRETRMLQ